MALGSADFRTAFAAVCAIVGRPAPSADRQTRHEWRAILEGEQREKQERLDTFHFAEAAKVISANVLEERGPCDEVAGLIEELRTNPRKVYRYWLNHDPKTTSAFVAAGRLLEFGRQANLLDVVENMAGEEHRNGS